MRAAFGVARTVKVIVSASAGGCPAIAARKGPRDALSTATPTPTPPSAAKQSAKPPAAKSTRRRDAALAPSITAAGGAFEAFMGESDERHDGAAETSARTLRSGLRSVGGG